jgi:hypothetical protein
VLVADVGSVAVDELAVLVVKPAAPGDEADEDVTAVVAEWLDPPHAAISSVIGSATKRSAQRLTAPA